MLFSTSRPKSCPQRLKPIGLGSFMYGLKPVPFIDSVSSQSVRPVPFTEGQYPPLELYPSTKGDSLRKQGLCPSTWGATRAFLRGRYT
jgi:hypothetical protein